MSLLVRNIGRLAPMRADPREVIENAAVVIDGGTVTWIGAERDLTGHR